ncbi:MAG: hypothetical protein MI749_21770 [Desulfovibrionales bacterium]|nr:hypothetical protein [Desulfovibrionales bacterium]
MKIATTFISIILIALCLSSCKEEDQNIVSGTVISYPNSDALGDVEVLLEVKASGQGNYTGGWDEINTLHTDAAGKYEFKFEPIRAQNYRLTLSKDTYRINTFEFDPKDFHDTYNFNSTMVKAATLYIHIEHLTGTSNADEIKVRVNGIPDECTDCTSSEFMHFYGFPIDTTLIYHVVGDQNVEVEYATEVNFDTDYQTRNLYIKPGDDNKLSITY